MNYNDIEIYFTEEDKTQSLSSFITKTEYESSSFTLQEINDLWSKIYGEYIFMEYQGFALSLIQKIVAQRGVKND